MITSEEREELLAKIDIVDLISQYVDLKKSGSGYKGYSPFKNENTPSFMVSPEKKIFKDFSSNIGGDAISFYMKINNLSYTRAVQELSKKYGVILKNSNYFLHDDKNSKYYDILKDVCDIYVQNLNEDENAREYLLKRGYTLEDIKRFKIGYAKDEWNNVYEKLKDKYSLEELQELGIVKKTNESIYDVYRNRITFPIYNIKKQIIAFGGRYIGSDKEIPKYLNSKESLIFKKSDELFGIFDEGKSIIKREYCILVEGFFDVLSLHKHGFSETVASLGTSFTDNQAKLLKKFTNNIIIAYDDDEAGNNAKLRTILLLNKYEFNIRILSLNKMAKDPDEFLFKYGKDEFLEKMKNSKDSFDYIYDYYKKDYDISKIPAKLKIIEDMKQFFSTLRNDIYRDEFSKRLSNNLELDISTVKKYLKFIKLNNQNVKEKQKKEENETVSFKTKQDSLEEETIRLLCLQKEYFNLFKNFKFTNPYLENIFVKLSKNKFNNIEMVNFDAEEEEIYFQITTQYQNENIIKNNHAVLYREWIKKEINEVLDIIIAQYGGINNIPIDAYERSIEIKKILKSIDKSRDIKQIENAYNIYKEYKEREIAWLTENKI